jgi:hypothetical protein
MRMLVLIKVIVVVMRRSEWRRWQMNGFIVVVVEGIEGRAVGVGRVSMLRDRMGMWVDPPMVDLGI